MMLGDKNTFQNSVQKPKSINPLGECDTNLKVYDNSPTPTSILKDVNDNIYKVKQNQERSFSNFRNNHYSVSIELSSPKQSLVR